MPPKVTTVSAYLNQLPADRRAAFDALRQLILANAGAEIEEGIAYGMIGYCIPHRIYPAGYHCNPAQPLPYAALASQKGYMSLHLMFCYGNEELSQWLAAAFAKAGCKLDMGKACLRFRSLDELPLDILAECFRKAPAMAYLERYQAMISGTGKAKSTRTRSTTASKPSAKTAAKATSLRSAKKPRSKQAKPARTTQQRRRK
jgi:hypothetical protein